MAIYLRTCPTAKTRMLGYLGALAAAGIALLYPLILLITAFALGSLDEAVDYPEGNESIADAATAVGATPLIFSFVLTSVIFGATSCFTGTDRWLPKDATVTYRDIASARFLHVARDPNSRAVGMLWAMLAGMLVTASPFTMMSIPHSLIYSDFTQDLAVGATWILGLAHIGLFVALKRAAVRRRASAVRLRTYGMAVADPKSFSLPPTCWAQQLQHPEGSGTIGSRESAGHLRSTHRRCRAGATGRHPAAQSDGETLTARRRPLPGRGPARRGLAGRTADTSLNRAGGGGPRTDIRGRAESDSPATTSGRGPRSRPASDRDPPPMSGAPIA